MSEMLKNAQNRERELSFGELGHLFNKGIQALPSAHQSQAHPIGRDARKLGKESLACQLDDGECPPSPAFEHLLSTGRTSTEAHQLQVLAAIVMAPTGRHPHGDTHTKGHPHGMSSIANVLK